MNDRLNSIRTINFNNIQIGGELSFPALNTKFVLNVPVFDTDKNFGIAKNFYNSDNLSEIIQMAQNSGCDILSLQFNIEKITELEKAKDLLKTLLPLIKTPLMISGSGNDDVDKLLIPELVKLLDRQVIINSANENTYKEIVPLAVKGEHILVLKTPIDINLAKELNILSYDMGLSLDKMIIDTDIGGLGYGLEYGYSIMEKIKIEGLKGDEYLNMPLISFAPNESLKTKEAKTNLTDSSWGNLEDRARYFEITSASAVMASGANLIVLNYPPNVKLFKELVK